MGHFGKPVYTVVRICFTYVTLLRLFENLFAHCDSGAEVEEGGVSIVPQDRIPERLLVGSFSHTTRVP